MSLRYNLRDNAGLSILPPRCLDLEGPFLSHLHTIRRNYLHKVYLCVSFPVVVLLAEPIHSVRQKSMGAINKGFARYSSKVCGLTCA
jgi:hypothetical protein